MVNITDMSLLEQMRFTDAEIESRKNLFDITDEDVQNLLVFQPFIRRKIDDIVDEFYTAQTRQRDVALVIGDRETLERLKTSMRRYILEIFEGQFDAQYIARRLRVGKVHKQIGVTPKLYMSAVRLLLTTLIRYVDRVAQESTNCAGCRSIHETLSKILLFDAQLVFDTYISSMMTEVNQARQQAESYALSLEEKVADRTRQLRDLSMRDGLTGLYNQRAFYDALRRELAQAERLGHPVALIYFDLNGFKKLNDTQGHLEGDRILTEVGKSLLLTARESDTPCRYGGDEFSLILPNADAVQAEQVCLRLISTFDAGDVQSITFSMGIAVASPEDGEDAEVLIRRADSAMYQAKKLARQDGNHHTAISARKGEMA